MSVTQATALRYRWVVILVLWAAYIVVFMHRLSIGPLAPFLKEGMGLNNAQVGSLMSAAAFGYMLSIVPGGWAVDRIGVRPLLLVGEVVGGIFMLGMFIAPSYQAAVAVMFISGFGTGCLLPATTKGVMVWFPLKERATAMGFKQTALNVGGAVSAGVLPVLALAQGWRVGFLFLGIIAIVIGVLSFIMYKAPPRPVPAYTGYHASSTTSAVTAGRQTMRDLLKTRDVWLVGFIGLALNVVEFAVLAQLVLYLTEALAIPVVTAGVILAVTQAGGVVGKPGAGILSDRFFGHSRRKVILLWSAISCVALIMIAFLGGNLSWGLYPVLFIYGVTGIGWGGVQLTLAAELAGIELAGRATGITGLLGMAGATLGPILFGYIVDASGSYQTAWIACVIIAAACVVLSYLVREDKRAI